MSEEEYEEMMNSLNNDEDYIAYCAKRAQETIEAIDQLTDAEIEEVFGFVG